MRVKIVLILTALLLFVSGCGNEALIPAIWIASGVVGSLAISSQINQAEQQERDGTWFEGAYYLQKDVILNIRTKEDVSLIQN